MNLTLPQIWRALLAFWALWFLIVASTNLGDAAVAAGIFPADWRFSGNYALIIEVTARHSTPHWLLPPLFAGVIAWEALACVLFARAWSAWGADVRRGRSAARTAYAAGLVLWCAFLLTDEIFMAFEVSDTHMRLLIAFVACLIGLSIDERASA